MDAEFLCIWDSAFDLLCMTNPITLKVGVQIDLDTKLQIFENMEVGVQIK